MPALMLALLGAVPLTASSTGTVVLELGAFVHASAQSSAAGRADLRLDEVELRLGAAFHGIASGRVELNYRSEDERYARARARSLRLDELLEQAFMSVDVLERAIGLRAAIGKLALPVGLEPPDADAAVFHSRSYTQRVGRPSFATGVEASLRLAPAEGFELELRAYAINGWELLVDDNTAKTFGAHLSLSMGDALRLRATYLAGEDPVPNRPQVQGLRQLLSADARAVWGPLTAGVEVAWVHHARGSQVLPDQAGRWLSVAMLLRVEVTSEFDLAARIEHAEDPDATRLSELRPQLLDDPVPGDVAGVPLDVAELSVALGYRLLGSVRAVAEWRLDLLTQRDDPGVFAGERAAQRFVLALSGVL